MIFNATETSHTISVPITDDNLVEFLEIFVVNLISATPVEITEIVDSQGECSIQIDEKYEIAVENPPNVGEKDGNTQFRVTVSPAIQAGDPYPVKVDYTTVNGSAVDTEDYTLTTGTLTFSTGDTFSFINVPITNDRLVDPGESFELLISNNDPVAITTITDNQATCQIDDNNFSLTIAKTGSGNGTLTGGNGSLSGLIGTSAPPQSLPMTIVYEVNDVVPLSAVPDVVPWAEPRSAEPHH